MRCHIAELFQLKVKRHMCQQRASVTHSMLSGWLMVCSQKRVKLKASRLLHATWQMCLWPISTSHIASVTVLV